MRQLLVPPKQGETYRPQLDALRAVAVLLVLYDHFWSRDGVGHFGVRLFFVISGFLITSILLKMKSETGVPLKAKLWTFFARRSLRIWPTYYLILLVAWIVDLEQIRSSILWHATYLSNFYFVRRGEWSSSTAHLWSLSVEEQFYLLWPFLILLVPKRKLVWVVALAIVLSVAFRVAAIRFLTEAPLAVAIATPASFDALGLGAALALAQHAGGSARRLQKQLWALSVVALVTWVALTASPLVKWAHAYEDLLVAVVFTTMVSAAYRGVRGLPGRILEWPAILFLGRISYGIYLYHLFVSHVVQRTTELAGVPLTYSQPARFLLLTSLTILVASLSWYLIERPIASLKRRLPYSGTGTDEAGRDAAIIQSARAQH